jgi:hypothetical protein
LARKIVLHIGAAKTGSSAIQAFIRANLDFFNDHGFVVPDRMAGLGQRITGEHVMSLQKLITDPDPSRIVEVFAELRDKPEDGRTVLISAENLSNLGKHARFGAALEGFDPTVILYIRRQDELLTSAWQQWHSKVEGDFNAWLIKGLREYGHWDRVIEQWESVVGKGRVKVRVFDRADLVEGDVLRDFLYCLGLDSKSDKPLTDLGVINPSYTDIITPLVQGNRGIFSDPNDSAFYDMVGDLTGDDYISGRKVSLLSLGQRESIQFYYRDINRRVCKEYFPGRAQLFLPLNHAKYDYLSADQMMERQMKFLTHLIFKLSQKKDLTK